VSHISIKREQPIGKQHGMAYPPPDTYPYPGEKVSGHDHFSDYLKEKTAGSIAKATGMDRLLM
jgi:hypothetical protein